MGQPLHLVDGGGSRHNRWSSNFGSEVVWLLVLKGTDTIFEVGELPAGTHRQFILDWIRQCRGMIMEANERLLPRPPSNRPRTDIPEFWHELIETEQTRIKHLTQQLIQLKRFYAEELKYG